MQNKLINYGFKIPVITETHYVEGDGRLLGASVLNPSGDWEKWLPKYEPQAEKFETFGCTDWGMQNQIETMHKYLYGEEPNYDERYNYNLVPINPPGADPQDTYETTRRFGLIQGLLPMTDTLEEFKTPRPMSDKYKEEGKKWLQTYFFDHDWVLTGKPDPEKLRTNLTKSDLGVSVTAWFLKDGVYVDNGQPNSHWCLLYKMDSDFYYVFDSYDHSKKKLPIKGHNINYAKRIVLYKKDKTEILKTDVKMLELLVNFLRNAIAYLKNNRVSQGFGEIITALFDKEARN